MLRPWHSSSDDSESISYAKEWKIGQIDGNFVPEKVGKWAKRESGMKAIFPTMMMAEEGDEDGRIQVGTAVW